MAKKMVWKAVITQYDNLQVLSWFDMILSGNDGEQARSQWSYEGDLILGYRSAAEFIREQLDPEILAKLDEADRIWRENPERFNAFFKYEHARKDVKTALEGFVWDQDANTPEIPKAHWWWWPLEV